jgi:hypothetical protein
MDRNRRTISLLDPYTPSGLIRSRSSALKSTFVIDANAPGHIVLTKRSRDSCAMITFSTYGTGLILVNGHHNLRGLLTVAVTPRLINEVQETVHPFDRRS